MCRSAVMLATRMSALVLAYSRWRTWPGCTTSNTPWHMMTFFLRGGLPSSARSSSTVLILWRYFSVSDESTCLPLSQVLEPGLGGLGDGIGVPQRSVAPIVDVGEDAGDAFLEADR